MPSIKSSAKTARRAQRRAGYNQIVRTATRTYVKRARQLIAEGKLEEAAQAVRQAESMLDKAATKGVIHDNRAARGKARLMALLNKAAQ